MCKKKMDIYLAMKRLFLDILLVLSAQLASGSGEAMEPRFVEPVQNVTVAIGRDATLACVVENLHESYKVAWIQVDTQTILTIHHHVITRNYRIHLTHSDHRYWYLHIRKVQESDRGYYMCQINTVPMRSRQGYLEIVVPPNILDSETSQDVVVKEGANVSLACKATGHPKPVIIWRREDGEGIPIGPWPVDTIDGEYLNVTRASRLHMGSYLCIASNGVPPSVSKRIVLQVHFPPQTWIPNQLVGGFINGEVVIECHTEAYPKSINYWTTSEGDMISSGEKYDTTLTEGVYKMHMLLKIRNLTPEDFGRYRCIARNFMGETDGTVTVYEIPAPTTTTTSSTEKVFLEAQDRLQTKEEEIFNDIEHSLVQTVEEIKDIAFSLTDSAADSVTVVYEQTSKKSGSRPVPVNKATRTMLHFCFWILQFILQLKKWLVDLT